jgi:hypothetical protein
MRNPTNKKRCKNSERGASLVLIAASMVVLLTLCALAIDIASFYVARSEAQRSADAAALAGAKIFATSSCTSGTGGCSALQTAATNEAITVGNKNLVSGANPNIQSGDITFNFTPVTDPRITVTVQRTSARGNALPTFFGNVLGISTVDVSATATAEAYNPGTGNGPAVGSVCVKPWLMPNCDPVNSDPAHLNPLCSGSQDYYIDPSTKALIHPSVIGTLLTIKPGSPGQTIAPSQFFPVILPPGTAPAECPTCSNGGGTGGAALYRQNIECCNTRTLSCGTVSLQPETGNVVGPTAQGVDCLIHEKANGSGQDILNTTSPLQITGGSNNPNPALVGQTINSSSSIVTAPIYDGAQLCPGQSCAASVSANIVGFMQLFVKDETNPQGTVEAYILNISTCGASSGGGGSGGSGGGGGTVTGGGLSPVPIRLVSQ